jgi:hypothetical protein
MLIDRLVARRHKRRLKTQELGQSKTPGQNQRRKTHHAGAIPIQRRKELSRFVQPIYNGHSLRKQTVKLSKSGQARVFGKFIAEQQKSKQREIPGRNCARNLDKRGLHDLAYFISWL